MLFTRLALLFVLFEIGCAGYGFFASSKTLYHIFIYGSPVYLAMNLLNGNSALLDNNVIIVGLLVFHVLKYLCFIQAQRVEERSYTMLVAVFLEACYLGYSAYRLI